MMMLTKLAKLVTPKFRLTVNYKWSLVAMQIVCRFPQRGLDFFYRLFVDAADEIAVLF